ncbi:hypothetical protein PAXRUDRAFT_834806 [Paxillus rubicundulus Ve08.2h10]|uniref:Uncharacterized protein n=1 Tax=Paxillus rubicundulus Ve08.2h10 TaxID=930991 RepID=A0A0D0DIN3_9AGAM|nr:hypothetical protein PAXRUDRAFT_834806 [Paxillus rubicundulus Ve08.2h10]
MPPKSPWWAHFYTNDKKYKSNNTHNNAWCEKCIQVDMQKHRTYGLAAFASGSMQRWPILSRS